MTTPVRAPRRRVVVTGMGALTPLGNDVATFWRRLVAGESGQKGGSIPIEHLEVGIGQGPQHFLSTQMERAGTYR